LGQELPPEPERSPKPEPQKTHVLKAGEGLISLARIYGVEPDALRAANPNIDFTKLKGGESVSIPIKLLPVFPVPSP
jgi:LysM repeat protein